MPGQLAEEDPWRLKEYGHAQTQTRHAIAVVILICAVAWSKPYTYDPVAAEVGSVVNFTRMYASNSSLLLAQLDDADPNATDASIEAQFLRHLGVSQPNAMQPWQSSAHHEGRRLGCACTVKQHVRSHCVFTAPRHAPNVWLASTTQSGSVEIIANSGFSRRRGNSRCQTDNADASHYAGSNRPDVYYTSRAGPFIGTDVVRIGYNWFNKLLNNRRRRRYRGWWDYPCYTEYIELPICVVDSDECDRGIDGCDHTCVNTQGSFYCECREEHYLEPSDGKTCVPCACDPGAERPACSKPLLPCVTCAPGTFKNFTGMGPCTHCSTCEPGYELHNCTATTDGICSACPNGKYKPDVGLWNSECITCAPCSDPGHVRVGCEGSSGGTCVEMQLLTPSCSMASCTEWWAGQSAEVVLSTDVPLCTGSACSMVVAKLQMTSVNGSVETVQDAFLTTNESTSLLRFRFVPHFMIATGHAYFVEVSVGGPPEHPHMSGTRRSDYFMVHDLEEWYHSQLLAAAEASFLGHADKALELTRAVCNYPLLIASTMEQNISEAYLSSNASISKSPRVETACARSSIIAVSGDFMGFHQNEVPLLDRGHFGAYHKTVETKIDLLGDLEQNDFNNNVQRAITKLMEQARLGEEVSMGAIQIELKKQSLENWNMTQLTRRKGMLREIEAKLTAVAEVTSQLIANMQERMQLARYVDEGLQEIGFYTHNFIDQTQAKIQELQTNLEQEVRAYQAAVAKAQKRGRLLKTIVGGLKVVVGAVLVVFQVPAGWVLVAQGTAEVVAAQTSDIEVPEFTWVTEKDTEGITDFMSGIGFNANVTRTAGGWLEKIDVTEKHMALTSRINGYIDKAEEILNSLFGKSMPAGTERIQELEVQLAEQQKIIALLRGVQAAQRTAGAVTTILEQHVTNLLFGIGPPVKYAASAKAAMLLVPVQHYLDVLRHDTVMSRESKVALEVQEKKIAVSVQGALELDVVYWEALLRQFAVTRELGWLKQELVELDLKVEQVRQELLQQRSIVVSTVAETYFLGSVSNSKFSLHANLVMDIHELLKKILLGLSYYCLDDTSLPSFSFHSARDFVTLKEMLSLLESTEVRCLEEHSLHTEHIATHIYEGDVPRGLNATGTMGICIPAPPVANGSSFYGGAKIKSVQLFLLGMDGEPRLVTVLLKRHGPVYTRGRHGKLRTFISSPREFLFQYDTAECKAQSSPSTECGDDEFTDVSAYGCWRVYIFGFESLPLWEVTGYRFAFSIQSWVSMNAASLNPLQMFVDEPSVLTSRLGEGCNVGYQSKCEAKSEGACTTTTMTTTTTTTATTLSSASSTSTSSTTSTSSGPSSTSSTTSTSSGPSSTSSTTSTSSGPSSTSSTTSTSSGPSSTSSTTSTSSGPSSTSSSTSTSSGPSSTSSTTSTSSGPSSTSSTTSTSSGPSSTSSTTSTSSWPSSTSSTTSTSSEPSSTSSSTSTSSGPSSTSSTTSTSSGPSSTSSTTSTSSGRSSTSSTTSPSVTTTTTVSSLSTTSATSTPTTITSETTTSATSITTSSVSTVSETSGTSKSTTSATGSSTSTSYTSASSTVTTSSSTTVATTSSATPVCRAGEKLAIMDFEGFNASEFVDQVCFGRGLRLDAASDTPLHDACVGLVTKGRNGGARIFDAACHGDSQCGGQPALFHPSSHNVLIFDDDSDSESTQPHADPNGGKMTFQLNLQAFRQAFSKVHVVSISLLGATQKTRIRVTVLADGKKEKELYVAQSSPDGVVQRLAFDASDDKQALSVLLIAPEALAVVSMEMCVEL